MQVLIRMGKWPHELASVPEDSYLAVALAIKEEVDEIQRRIDEAEKKFG